MVTVYTLPVCQKCDQTKTLMRREGIIFNEVDLSEDDEAREYVRDWLGFRQAPVVETHEDAWSGFQPDLIRRLAAEE